MPAKRALTIASIVAVLMALPKAAQALDADSFARALAKGPVYAGLIAFAGGLMTCLTPCVYPMIVITVSVFGARNSKNRAQAMALSTCFVLGVVAMYTPLGVVAALTGNVFGAQLSSPWVLSGTALVFLVLAASMFGAYDITLPSGVMNRLAGVGGAGYVGAVLLGLVSGLIAAPCTTPVLLSMLVWIGKTRSTGLGAVAMALYALGLGLPFWLVGTFALRLPKGGAWTVAVKTVFGIAMAALALWFVRPLVPIASIVRPGTAFGTVAALAAAAGVLASTVRAEQGGSLTLTRKIGGIVVGTAGVVLLVSWWQLPRYGIAWAPYTTPAVVEARTSGKPVLVDFTADWCAACQELARNTFSDGEVIAESNRFVRLRVDATNDDDPTVDAAKRQFSVRGLPTVLVVDSEGRERARIVDFVPAHRVLAALREAR